MVHHRHSRAEKEEEKSHWGNAGRKRAAGGASEQRRASKSNPSLSDLVENLWLVQAYTLCLPRSCEYPAGDQKWTNRGGWYSRRIVRRQPLLPFCPGLYFPNCKFLNDQLIIAYRIRQLTTVSCLLLHASMQIFQACCLTDCHPSFWTLVLPVLPGPPSLLFFPFSLVSLATSFYG